MFTCTFVCRSERCGGKKRISPLPQIKQLSEVPLSTCNVLSLDQTIKRKSLRCFLPLLEAASNAGKRNAYFLCTCFPNIKISSIPLRKNVAVKALLWLKIIIIIKKNKNHIFFAFKCTIDLSLQCWWACVLYSDVYRTLSQRWIWWHKQCKAVNCIHVLAYFLKRQTLKRSTTNIQIYAGTMSSIWLLTVTAAECYLWQAWQQCCGGDHKTM